MVKSEAGGGSSGSGGDSGPDDSFYLFFVLISRVEPSMSGVSSFKHLVSKLPPRVHSVYYRDNIGNISTSHLRTGYSKSELEIEPRYPLLGGWRATFVIGYGLPLQDFLFESSDGKRLSCLKDQRTPLLSLLFSVEHSSETKYTYLDIVGRPVVHACRAIDKKMDISIRK
ncbi:hypothetical protein LXL04_002987 [Taraxacum kok-saghyz]